MSWVQSVRNCWPRNKSQPPTFPHKTTQSPESTLNNHSFNRLNAELREGDPLCSYVTVERSSIELTLAQHAENTAQLAIACELLQRTRAELLRAWNAGGKQLQPYQEAALHSINECLNVSHPAIRRYRHSVRYEYAANRGRHRPIARDGGQVQHDIAARRHHHAHQNAALNAPRDIGVAEV